MHVVVVFTGVELTGNGGNPVTITFPAPKSIDLMTQSGTASAVLFDQPIPSGSYGQIRLMVVADGSANNSYIDFANGSRLGLRVPSGSETGFKLVSGFHACRAAASSTTRSTSTCERRSPAHRDRLPRAS